MPDFAHLHVHTQYSLLDGAASIPSLYKKAGEDKMAALAITDHGNMFGAFEFVSTAWKKTKVIGKDAEGKDILTPTIKPIVGCEFYVVETRHQKTFTKDKKDRRFHQVLLAKNALGYQNLIKLTSLGYIEGMYSKYPRIDKELIAQYREGLIATTCCIGAHVPQMILKADAAVAEAEFKWWLDMFGEDYYIELQRHNIPEQDTINEVLLGYSKKYNVPVIATNDSHYTEQSDSNAHDILLCVNTGEKQSTPGFDDFINDDAFVRNRRFKFPNDQFYFKTKAEMASLFSDVPQSIDNTMAVVEKIEVLNLKKDILLPAFPIPQEFLIHTNDEVIGKSIIKPDVNNQWEYLKHLTMEGAKIRYNVITPEIEERLNFELFTIKTMGFAGYFLIVSDFIKAGKEMGVYVGPGRGSAAGSVVAYCIGITNIDPMKYNLLFERFLNPDRKSMPDIDTDFDDIGRDKVIDYVVAKYGKAQVAQIITYGTMAAKSSIKDVARVLDLPLQESNALAKLVPDRPGTDLGKCLHSPITKKDGEKSLEEEYGLQADDIANVKKLREIYAGNDINSEVLHEAERLEGSVRSVGTHASAIIIAPQDLTELIPISIAKDSELWVTQIEGGVIEEAGVLKMDFLGLKTLSILKTALELIKQNHNIDIVIDDIPLDDADTYKLYQRAETNGTFQFESVGMQKYLKDLKPDRFGDLIAMNALFRPGPLAYIPSYIKRKNGQEPIKYDLPEMEEILKETYGITVYQEQVMLLSQKLAGFTKGNADVLRKAMGKKDRKTLDKLKPEFIDGAVERGHDAEKLEKIWKDWEAFAQYAFNKSHSTCYAFVAYQTAYLKTHYPAEYMAAVLNNAGNIEKITFFMDECKRMGLKVLGPDINESLKGFAVNQKGEIRFGLGGIKGAGEAAVEALISDRNTNGVFTDLFNFGERMGQRSITKKIYEMLALSGGFDCFPEYHRAQYMMPDADGTTLIDKVVRYGSAMQADANSAVSLFGASGDKQSIVKPKIGNVEHWSAIEQLQKEKEVVGFYISGHPLDDYKLEIKYFANSTIEGYKPTLNKHSLVPGIVTKSEVKKDKRGMDYATFTIEDFTSTMEFRIFSEDYLKFQNLILEGNVILCKLVGDNRFGKLPAPEPRIVEISLLGDAPTKFTRSITLKIPIEKITEDTINQLDAITKDNPGDCPMKIELQYEEEKISIPMHLTKNKLNPSGDLFIAFAELDDVEMVLN
ncbi:MAG: DNA polymerase III subunit alpha [Bacteroidetes bacterium]|nr:DNA polymerase III subunit alpha [Bacteroidota bacterium]